MKYVLFLLIFIFGSTLFAANSKQNYIQFMANNPDKACSETLDYTINSINNQLEDMGLNFQIVINSCKLVEAKRSVILINYNITLAADLEIHPLYPMTADELSLYRQKQQDCMANKNAIKFYASIDLKAGSSTIYQIMTAAGFEPNGNQAYKSYQLDRCKALDNEFFGEYQYSRN